MMSKEMYREHIMELYRDPLNFGKLEHSTHSHREHNPLCGDDITIQLIVKDNKVEEVKFKGHGCAISMASASLLTEKVKGMSLDEIKKMKAQDLIDLLEIPVGPVRMKCALISLEALHKSIGLNPKTNHK